MTEQKLTTNHRDLVSAIEKVTAHDHLCLIYENQEEQFAAIVPFISVGLKRHEKCVYICDDNSSEVVLSALRTGGIDIDTAIKSGDFTIITKRDAYLKNGYFDPDEMIEFLKQETLATKKAGYSALRVTGEMTWILGGEPGTDRLIEYEAKLNIFFPEYDCSAVCQYNKKRFSSDILINVIRTHPKVIVGNIVCKNFYYVPAEEFLKAGVGTDEEVNRLLSNLIDRELIEKEREINLFFLKGLDQVNQAIQKSEDLERMMSDVLDVVLTLFDCDRAWLVYPGNPQTTSYQVPMERTRPEYPGASARGLDIPVDPETRLILQAAKESSEPVAFDKLTNPPLPNALFKNFNVQSQVVVTIYPKIGESYIFGLHQCSYARIWTKEEKNLLREIGHRLSDGLTSLLMLRDLKKNNETILQKQQQLVEAQRIGHFGSFDWDARTDSIEWSAEYYLIYGFDPGTKPPGYLEHLKTYTPESAAQLDASVKNSLQTGEPYTVDLEHIRPDGNRKWITVRGEVKRDQDSNIIGLRGTAQDITDRKLAEAELSRTNRNLRMLSVINQTLIHITDEKSLLEEIANIIVKLGGYRLMWIGMIDNDQKKIVHPVAQAGFGTDYLKFTRITWAEDEFGRGPTGTAIRTGKTQIIKDISIDPKMTPWQAAAIERGYKSSIAIPMISENVTLGAINIYANETNAFDQTEINILEELTSDLAFGLATLRLRGQVEKRTQEIDQLKNKFIQIVSHQLRTPLTVIRWNLEMLLERKRGELSVAQEEVIQGTYVADIEIISRIDDLMIALDIEENRLRLENEQIEINELIRSACEEGQQKSKLKHISYEIFAPKEPLPLVEADASKIRSVISRLIDNAITYTEKDGHIKIIYSQKKDKIRFEISDTGIGIPDSEQPRIFERFHRGWNAALMKPDASGLGLFISKNYIVAHQGEIGFTSKEKHGSTFWFELPIKKIDDRARATRSEKSSPRG